MQVDDSNPPVLRDLVINKQIIKPGEDAVVKLDVGRLHSDMRVIMNLFVYRAEQPGPTALFLGGIHGDEINGIEIIRRAIDSGMLKNLLAGTVIAIPLVNMHGFSSSARGVSEGKDVNRNFPGSRSGSMASRVANLVAKTILPEANLIVDFHTGGAARFNYPQVRYTTSSADSLMLATQFSPRFIIAKPAIRGSLRKIARDANVPMILYEGGEALRLDHFAIEKGLHGLERVLIALSMLPVRPGLATSELSVHVQKNSWLRATRAGIFTWTKGAGACVVKGEPLGTITDPYGVKTISVIANKTGYIIGHNNAPLVSQGDALFNIAHEYSILSKPLA